MYSSCVSVRFRVFLIPKISPYTNTHTHTQRAHAFPLHVTTNYSDNSQAVIIVYYDISELVE